MRDDALYLAYISLFEAEEGVPEHPDIMLGYMHKAMALLLANPQLLDKIDSKNVTYVGGISLIINHTLFHILNVRR